MFPAVSDPISGKTFILAPQGLEEPKSWVDIRKRSQELFSIISSRAEHGISNLSLVTAIYFLFSKGSAPARGVHNNVLVGSFTMSLSRLSVW